MRFVKNLIKRVIEKFGYRLTPRRKDVDSWERRYSIIVENEIDFIIDGGAHLGNYTSKIFDKIGTVSFLCVEASPYYAQLLRERFENTSRVRVEEYALSSSNGKATFNIASRASSSSLFEPTDLMCSKANMVVSERIEVNKKSVDLLLEELSASFSNIYLKLDVQGGEKDILENSRLIASHVKVLEVEVSLSPLYDQQWYAYDIFKWCLDNNFKVISIEPGFADPDSGHVLQVDVIAIRDVRS